MPQRGKILVIIWWDEPNKDREAKYGLLIIAVAREMNIAAIPEEVGKLACSLPFHKVYL